MVKNAQTEDIKPTLDISKFPENVAFSITELLAHLEHGRLEDAITSLRQIKSLVEDSNLYEANVPLDIAFEFL